MKFNEKIEQTVKKSITRGKVGQSDSDTNESNGDSDRNNVSRRSSMPVLHGGGTKFRQGVLQLMISSVDPLNDGTVDPEKFRSAMLKSMNGDVNRNNSNGGLPGSNGTVPSIQVTQVTLSPLLSSPLSSLAPFNTLNSPSSSSPLSQMSEGEKETPLDVSWPKEWHKQITYVILFPIIILLWLTLPDVRRTVSDPLSFSGSSVCQLTSLD